MLFNTFVKYPFTADVYSTQTQNADSGALAYGFLKSINCQVYFDGTGRIMVHVPDGLAVGYRLNNIRDKAGELVAPSASGVTGKEYEVTDYEGVVNPFGFRDSVRYTAVPPVA